MLATFIDDPSEDSLTAAVFSHLLHLPAGVFWQVLRGACHNGNLPLDAGEILRIESWPKWDAEGTDNIFYVEPDLYLRFTHFDLMIEAKRWDGGMQNPAQWCREVTAYANEYRGAKAARPVHLIALGAPIGEPDTQVTSLATEENTDKPSRPAIHCPVHMCRWERLLGECQWLRNRLRRLYAPDTQSCAHLRILDDVIELFSHHGFQTGQWLTNMVGGRPRLSPDLSAQHRIFQAQSKRLCLP